MYNEKVTRSPCEKLKIPLPQKKKKRERESLDIIYPYFRRESHEDEILADENHDQAAETEKDER